MKVYPKHPNLMSEGTLRDDKVINSRGEDLGKIEDFMIDPRAGRVAYAILSFGGFMGLGNKLFAVPWNAMDLDTDRHAFVLDIDKDRLRDAPGFDKNNWPDLMTADWRDRVHTFYNQTPYWS
jgi:sporulation protein YlmC with PRC-barrel domain